MALSRHHAALTRPRSVEEIVREAEDFDFSNARSLGQWLRASRMLLTEAAICEQEGNLPIAYLYLYRHAELVLAKFPEHPEYRDPRFKAELAQARKTLQRNLVKLEQWKPRITQEHQRYQKAMERRDAERQRVQAEFNEIAKYGEARRGSLESDTSTHALDVNENREFAVNLAQREIRRRDASRQSTVQAGISPATVAERRKGLVAETPDNFDIREAGRHLEENMYQGRKDSSQSRQPPLRPFHYPHVPQKEDSMSWSTSPPDYPPPRAMLPPTRSAKEPLYNDSVSELPTLPPKHRLTPSPPNKSTSLATTSKYTFQPSSYTESGRPLRTLLLPPELRTAFLNLAHPNTAQNLETCGILCATLISNALFITHLIIPDQTSTSDTCDTTEAGDNALFDYCDASNLLVCGWIHTHPSQTCFLSSRDLHTSSGYQVMLPEAIAIVCSPRHTPDYGIFRLTDPPGLPHVLECTAKGLFHPHSESNLYTDAVGKSAGAGKVAAGHVVEGPGMRFEVVDLRVGRK